MNEPVMNTDSTAVAILMSNVCLGQIEVVKARALLATGALTKAQCDNIVDMRDNMIKLFEAASGESIDTSSG